MNGEPVRLFIAVFPPRAVAEACAATGREFSPADGFRVRLVHWEQMHLTLRFLGATDPRFLEPLQRALRTAAESISPFTAWPGQRGAFPKPRQANVLWRRLEPASHLRAIAERVDEALETLGILPDTKPFQPHLTVARTSPRKGRGFADVREWASTVSTVEMPFTVSAMALVRSTLGPAGPRYTREAEIPLLGASGE